MWNLCSSQMEQLCEWLSNESFEILEMLLCCPGMKDALTTVSLYLNARMDFKTIIHKSIYLTKSCAHLPHSSTVQIWSMLWENSLLMSLSRLVGIALWRPAEKLRSTDAKWIPGALFTLKLNTDNLLTECFSYNENPVMVSSRNLDAPAHIVGREFIVHSSTPELTVLSLWKREELLLDMLNCKEIIRGWG